jgi:phosphatidylglycerophosphate synthase
MRWMGWLLWGVEAAGGVVVVVLAPIAAVYAFVTGEPKQGLLALGLFVAGLVYLVLVIFDAIDRPWARRRKR